MTQPSSSSGVFFQGVDESQITGNSQLLSVTGHHGRANFIPFSGDADNAIMNSVSSSGPSIGGSSLLTGANSGLPHPRRNGSFNSDAYMRLSASPLSFTSNNVSISGSTFMDGSSVLQQGLNSETGIQSQMHQVGSSSASMSTSRMGQDQHLGGPRISGSFIQDTNVMSPTQLPKKLHMDIKQEDPLQQQVLQQQLQRHDRAHLQNSNTQLQALLHQQRLRQQLEQQQLLQRVQLLRQHQLRQQLIQQGMQPPSRVKPPYENGVCSRRLMQYLYHQRQRPADNTIAYWRKVVAEYYSPRAKKRWCLALYDNVGNHSLGVFPQTAMDAWQCDICGSKSGKGFEATYEVLPRLEEIKFASGVLDELLYLDLPREHRFPSGMMMLEYAKAVQESVFEQIRVVREGQLRIVFTPDLKILSWEFCARCHEELLPRRLVLPQAKQLLQVAQKCQGTVTEGGSDGASKADLQANSAMVATASRQLARCLGLQSLNDLGFSKRYVRCLQIAEVVSSMKDLMDLCAEVKVGPVEGLKNFSKNASNSKLQMQKNQELGNAESLELPADHDPSNKMMALQNSHGGGALAGSAQAALALSNYQNSMARHNSSNTSLNSLQETSNVFARSNQAPVQPSFNTGTSSVFSRPSQQQQTPQQQQSIPGQKQCVKEEPSYSSIPSTSSAGNQSNNNGVNAIPSAASPSLSNNIDFGFKASDFTQNLHLPDDFVADIAREFTDSGFFDTDLDDNMNFSWKV